MADDLAMFRRLAAGPESQRALAKLMELGEDQKRNVFELGLDETMADLHL